MTNTTSYVRNHAFLFLLVRKFVAREASQQRRSTKPRFHHLRVSHSRKGQGGALPANSSEASDEGYTSRSGDCTRAVERQAEVSALPLRCAGSRSKNGPGASTSSSRALQVDASLVLSFGFLTVELKVISAISSIGMENRDLSKRFGSAWNAGSPVACHGSNVSVVEEGCSTRVRVRVPAEVSGQGTVAVGSPASRNTLARSSPMTFKKRKRPPALSISNGESNVHDLNAFFQPVAS